MQEKAGELHTWSYDLHKSFDGQFCCVSFQVTNEVDNKQFLVVTTSVCKTENFFIVFLLDNTIKQ